MRPFVDALRDVHRHRQALLRYQGIMQHGYWAYAMLCHQRLMQLQRESHLLRTFRTASRSVLACHSYAMLGARPCASPSTLRVQGRR